MSDHKEYACAAKGCGHVICLAPELEQRLRRTHEWWYCPAGHSQQFAGKTQVEKELDAMRERWRLAWRDASDWRQAAYARDRTCQLCGVRFRAPGSVLNHLRAPVADGGHGAQDVEREIVELVRDRSRGGFVTGRAA